MNDEEMDPLKVFFIPLNEKDLTITPTEFDLKDALHPLTTAFCQNLRAVVSTVSVPYFMATGSVSARRFMQIHMAERIRALKQVKPNEPLTPELEEAAKRKAHTRMKEEPFDWANEVLAELRNTLVYGEITVASQELIRQGLVLAWGTFEVLVRDMIETLINGDPLLASKLMEDDAAKKLFSLKGLAFDTLTKYGFDVSRRMGSILLEQHPVDSIPAMKTLFQALFPGDTQVREALDNRDLYLLNQRRHLIVHRRGIIDRDYIRLTKEGVLGERLVLSPDNLEHDLLLLRDVGSTLLRASSRA